MHSLSLTEWHACPGNVHIYGAFNCILNVPVFDGVISTCVTCVGENNYFQLNYIITRCLCDSANRRDNVVALMRN